MTRSLCLVAALVFAGTALAEAPAIGAKVEDLSFTDIRYLPRTLKDLGEHKAYLFLFHTQEDTDALKALDAIAESAKEAVVAALDETPKTPITAVAGSAVELDGDYTVLKDYDAKAAAALGIAQTPAAVLLDADRALRYRGTLDGAKAALDALLAGGEIATPEQPVEGKAIAPDVPAATGDVTFAKDVAPVINKHCVACHRPGEAAPFSLMTYGQVSSRADVIAEVVREERMPPWYASPAHGKFMNARRLSPVEKDTVIAWVKGGMKEGDLESAPKPAAAPDSDWRIKGPDLVIASTEEDTIPPTGYVDYKYTQLPYQFTEDTWVQGIEILPSNLSVVHHVNLAYNIPGSEYQEQSNFLTGRVPGNPPVDIPGPVAMLIPKDSVLFLQIHYVTNGKTQNNTMKVGINYAKGPIMKRVYYRRLRPAEIDIPPNDPRHRMEANWTFDRNALAVALFSHMHVRGRDMSFFAKYPDGKEETLLIIPNYNFDWQLAYQYVPGTKLLPKGTELKTVSHYDNSAFNPYNPDPNAEVPYGDQTIHEMNDAYIFYIDADEMLNKSVDPATGHEVTKEALAKAE